MKFEGEKIEYRDSDEYLKPELVKKLMEGWDLYIRGQTELCFKTLVSIYSIFHMREFPLKEKLSSLNHELTMWFHENQGRPITKSQQIKMIHLQQSLQKHVYDYLLDLTTSMDYLGLLLKKKIDYNDLQIDLSEQNFGDKMSLANQQRKELIEEIRKGNLTVETLLSKKYTTNNQIYHTYGIWRYDNAIKE